MRIIFVISFSVCWIGDAQHIVRNNANKPPLSRIHVDPSSGHFMDENGRVRMFRGINVVNKNPPYYYDKLLNKTILNKLAKMGMNIVRLGNMWNGWQPTGPDNINETYANILEQTVKELEDNNIYTLLDVHQDGLFQGSGYKKKGGYWGVPPWIKDKLIGNAHKFPWPFKGMKSWPCRYFTEEISNGFGRFYQNYNGTADDFARFWSIVAGRFKDHRGVIGYELLNEPWTANIYNDAINLLPGVAGKKFLQQFYDKLQHAIRNVDDQTIIFWEPVTWGYFVKMKPSHNVLSKIILKTALTEKNLHKILSYGCGELQTDSDIKGMN